MKVAAAAPSGKPSKGGKSGKGERAAWQCGPCVAGSSAPMYGDIVWAKLGNYRSKYLFFFFKDFYILKYISI